VADGIVQVAPDSTGKKVDTSEITVGANTVERQRINIADPVTAANIAIVSTSNADGDAGGMAMAAGAYNRVWNGSTWDRWYGDLTNGGFVNVKAIQAPSATGTIAALNGSVTLNVLNNAGAAIDLRGTFTATVTFQGTVDGTNFFNLVATPVASAANVATVTTATAAGTWFVQCAGCVQIRATATAYTSGTITVVARGMVSAPWVYNAPVGTTNAVTISGSPTINTITTMPSLVAATALIGDTGIQYRANATGAASTSSILSPATPAGASIKASAGRLLGWTFQNSAAAVRSVKLFNQTAVTMGTTSALFEIDIPASGSANFYLSGGIAFSTGIMWAVTSAKGLTDNTATGLAANDVTGAAFFA
jgi:hypothetical protein